MCQKEETLEVLLMIAMFVFAIFDDTIQNTLLSLFSSRQVPSSTMGIYLK